MQHVFHIKSEERVAPGSSCSVAGVAPARLRPDMRRSGLLFLLCLVRVQWCRPTVCRTLSGVEQHDSHRPPLFVGTAPGAGQPGQRDARMLAPGRGVQRAGQPVHGCRPGATQPHGLGVCSKWHKHQLLHVRGRELHERHQRYTKIHVRGTRPLGLRRLRAPRCACFLKRPSLRTQCPFLPGPQRHAACRPRQRHQPDSSVRCPSAPVNTQPSG